MESLLPMIIQLVSGAVGGNAAGAALKNLSLGNTGNSVVGAIGGLLGSMAASGQLEGMIGNIVGGGAGGAILLAIVGFIKKSMAKK
ncbi:hypothetical protein [Arenimonas sp.]|jgi:hypothetical protein|uniref:hypothetical protein n=1 Tax=Arenimonas sp. TaxID=1872635 RepID=UPI0037BF4637